MKKHSLLLVLIATIFFACKPSTPSNQILFTGKINNSTSDTVRLLNNKYQTIDTIVLKPDHSFSKVLTYPEGLYRLQLNNNRAEIYLKPGLSIDLSLNADSFNESMIFTGSGAIENNYLVKKQQLEQGFGKLTYYGYYGKLEEPSFLSLVDSLYQLRTDLLQNSEVDNDFKILESNNLKYQYLTLLADYEFMYRYLNNNPEFNVSKSYPNIYKNVDLSNETLISLQSYQAFIQNYIGRQVQRGVGDYSLEQLKTIVNMVKSPKVKQELLYKIGQSSLERTEKLDSTYTLLRQHIGDQHYLNTITDFYSLQKRIAKGADSPSFNFSDINGNALSLEMLKGKLVYIDIWATWCLPCIKEIPHLKALEHRFKGQNIAFVSICSESKEEDWKKMIADKELDGIQLYAQSYENAFFKAYGQNGFPRFILIDTEGKIIDANAKRPSNDELIPEIESYLQ